MKQGGAPDQGATCQPMSRDAICTNIGRAHTPRYYHGDKKFWVNFGFHFAELFFADEIFLFQPFLSTAKVVILEHASIEAICCADGEVFALRIASIANVNAGPLEDDWVGKIIPVDDILYVDLYSPTRSDRDSVIAKNIDPKIYSGYGHGGTMD